MRGTRVVDDTPEDGDGAQVIEVRTAAIPQVVPTLRTIAADIAMRQDFDLDAIEDLRMAVDEACSLLLPSASDGNLTCVFSAMDGRIEISVSVLADSAKLTEDNALGWQLLTALATSARRTVTPGEGGFFSRIDVVRECEAAAQ
jgi:serine/threonine-protein kinase RsbW